MSRRDFRFATAEMREGRMLRMFTGLVAGCCFALAAFAAVVQFAPRGPIGIVPRRLLAAVIGDR